MKPKKLSHKIFLESFKYAPKVAVNLLLKDKNGKILLAKRNKPPFKDYWHIAGSFLHKGERLIDCANRVASEELGINIKNKEKILIGVFDDISNDPRGHVVDIVYEYIVEDEVKFKPKSSRTKEIRFFRNLPSEIGFNHRETLHKLGFNDI